MTDDKSSIDLDLDALAPQQVQINYQGEIIKVNPLDMVMFAKLYDLSAELAKLKDLDNPEQVLEAYKKLEAFIKEVLPELKDKELNQVQLMAIFDLLLKLNTPQDKALAELEKRGISLKKGAKKIPQVSTSPEQ